MFVYLATFFLIRLSLGGVIPYWTSLISAVVATTLAMRLLDRRPVREVGLQGPPRVAVGEFLKGCLFAAALIAAADVVIIVFTPLYHRPGSGVPWRELLTIYIAAALHEELVFRGYPFQKIWRRHRVAGIVISSLIFAFLHAGNSGVTMLALVNVALGGVLLAVAWERFERLWFPIGIHLAWNVASGPVLGYGVSGFETEATLVRTDGSGVQSLTGGEFGIEGSAVMTLAELIGVALLLKKNAEKRRKKECLGDIAR